MDRVDDADYSKRWGAIKKHYTQSWLALGGSEKPLTASRIRHRRRGVWQPRFLRQAQDRFGNMPCAMSGTMPGILITSTTIRRNMVWWNVLAIGRIPLFTVG